MPASELLRRDACPGVTDAMEAADGWLMRVRLPGGQIDAAQLAAVAEVAACHGSGVVEITSRANLQVRGVPGDRRELAAAVLIGARLAHPDPRIDARRAILAPALAGHDPTEQVDVSPYVAAVEQSLVTLLRDLPPKFTVVVDGGGALGVASVRGDIVITVAAREPVTGPVVGVHAHVEPDRSNVIAAPPFGRLDVGQLTVLAGVADEHPVRLTHLRGVAVAGVPTGAVDHLVGRLAAAGLSSDPTDPVHGVTACAGRPGCSSARAETLSIAAELVAERRAGVGSHSPIHFSGCEKRCGAPAGIEHRIF